MTPVLVQPTQRRLASWIEGFLSYSSVLSSPAIFRRWVGISIIAAALERRVWVRTKGADLYPNLYVVLVGPPGIGKSTVMSHAERLLHAVSDLHVAPSSVTTASLVDSLNDAKRKIIRPTSIPNFVEYNCLTVIASEFGVFLPEYDNAFMNSLTKFYDGERYSERRRSKDIKIIIEVPLLTILGGTTPSYLNHVMPEGAWNQGFASRTIFVYSGDKVISPVFSEAAGEQETISLYKELLHDLKIITNSYGQMSWSQEAADAVSEWNAKDGPPQPEHPKLLHYNSRRVAHLLKLCIIAATSRTSTLIIEEIDYQTALSWLLEAEDFMPDIFKSMTSGGDSQAIEDAWFFCYQTHMKEKRPILEHRVVNLLRDRVPSHSVMRVIEVMVRGNLLKREIDAQGNVVYTPNARERY